jgi:hypothetical protein
MAGLTKCRPEDIFFSFNGFLRGMCCRRGRKTRWRKAQVRVLKPATMAAVPDKYLNDRRLNTAVLWSLPIIFAFCRADV